MNATDGIPTWWKMVHPICIALAVATVDLSPPRAAILSFLLIFIWGTRDVR